MTAELLWYVKMFCLGGPHESKLKQIEFSQDLNFKFEKNKNKCKLFPTHHTIMVNELFLCEWCHWYKNEARLYGELLSIKQQVMR